MAAYWKDVRCLLRKCRPTKRVAERENRTLGPIAARHGGTCHRYRDRCVTHANGSIRRAAGCGWPSQRRDHGGTATGNAALDHQCDYPRSATRQLVHRLSIRCRDRAPALARPPQNLPFVESFAADMTPPVICRICSPALVNWLRRNSDWIRIAS